MRKIVERFLRSAEVPNPERAEELWAEYRDGGPGAGKAFATLLAWYGNAVYRRIWGFVRSDAAEDVFQDVLTKLHKRREKLESFEHALRWMRAVAVAFSLNALQGDKRQRARDQRVARPEAEPPGESATELQEMLRAGLAKLPEAEREAVALHYFEGLTKRDAAAVLGIDRDTLAKRLQEALAKLRQLAPAVAAAGGVAGLEARLGASPPLPPARMATLIAAVAPVAAAGWLASAKAKVIAAVLVVGVVSAVSGYVLSRSPDMPPKSPNLAVRLGVEPLEARTVPAAGFASALSVGNAAGSTDARDVVTDAAGNSYVTGYFMGTVDFDPARTHPGNADILTARGSDDIYVAKYAADNTLIWARRMGGDEVNNNPGAPDAPTDIGHAVHVDGGGNVYVTGKFKQTADFGPITLTAASEYWDGFVVKLDASGSVQWANRWGGGVEDEGKGVATDPAGNVYVLGARAYRDASGMFVVNANHGIDVLKYNPAGGAVWAKWVNTRYLPTLNGDLAVDAAGNVFVAGAFNGTVDFDPGSKSKFFSSGTGASGFVLKLTSAGNYSWASTFSANAANSDSKVNQIALDGNGNVIVGGSYRGTVDFKPGNGTTALPAVGGGYIAKLSGTGSLVWARAIENASFTFVYGLDTDAAGNVYATGNFQGTADFDPGAGVQTRTSAGGNDAYVLKLTATGDFAWAETFGASGNDLGYGIDVNAAGTVHLSGRYRGTVDFDPGAGTHELTAPGDKASFFLVKLSQN